MSYLQVREVNRIFRFFPSPVTENMLKIVQIQSRVVAYVKILSKNETYLKSIFVLLISDVFLEWFSEFKYLECMLCVTCIWISLLLRHNKNTVKEFPFLQYSITRYVFRLKTNLTHPSLTSLLRHFFFKAQPVSMQAHL